MADTSGLINLLLYFLIGGLIVWVCYWILGMLALPEPIGKIVSIIVAVIVLLWILSTLGFVAI
jgi:putative flippase GtrA